MYKLLLDQENRTPEGSRCTIIANQENRKVLNIKAQNV